MVYNLSLNEGDAEWHWERLTQIIEGYPKASYYSEDDGVLYIVTSEGLFSINKNGTIRSYDVPEDIWIYLNQNSIVYIDGTIFVGTGFGIYAQAVGGGESAWYPLDPY